MMVDTRALIGRTLGDFTVGAVLGEGGYGVVYRAEQRTLGRDAVIKVLHARHGTDEAIVQRFLREAQLASRLDHPFAAHIYAFGAEPDGLLWIAMELVRGTTLREVLDAQPGGRLPLARLVPLLDGLCEVVHTAHEQGIVHRDLKPDNVMVLARAGRLLPKLLDLGIAKLVTAAAALEAPLSGVRTAELTAPTSATIGGVTPVGLRTQTMDPTAFDERGNTLELTTATANLSPYAMTAATPHAKATPRDSLGPGPMTQDGAVIGSPHYMAPEQWSGDSRAPIDGRVDQYALGVVAYEMIAGRLPFVGGSLPAIAKAHLHDAMPPLPDGVPVALTAVLARALAKRPADRFASALAFAEAVRAAAGLRMAAEALPRLPDELRAELAWLPQPIADAIAELESARNPHQARDALWQIVHITARWLGVMALCARSRTAVADADAPAVAQTLRELARRELTDEEWIELVRALARPFAELREAHPMPELVDFALAEPSPFAPLLALHTADSAAAATEPSLREWLAATLPVLVPLLRAIRFLGEYQLIAPCRPSGESADVWMGTRRTARPVISIAPGLPPGEPVIADLDGRPLLALAPLVQIAPPAPDAPDELFVFAGPGRIRGRGARLVAEPHGFERHDEQVWTWFRAGLLAADEDAAAPSEQAPYRGLAAFTEADAAGFFGRERAVSAFVNQLRTQPLLAVVGPSGTGKSSFVRAGVIPALPDGWRARVIRPGASPMAALATLGEPTITGETLVLVVDQLEELFTLCLDRHERDQFAAALARLTAEPTEPAARVVLTVRDDFLARAGELPALRDRLARAVTLLATPDTDDLIRVIVEPARRAGYQLDDGLAHRMVEPVIGQPGALALLSFTALRLWELRDRHFRRLTAASYEAIGGVEGALAHHAEDTLRACTAHEQRLVREAFRHLVTAEGTRAQLTRAELLDVLGSTPAASAVIDRLIDARLVVVADAAGSSDAAARIEIIHEALLAAWPRLVEWRREDAEGARLRDQLRAAARQWDDRGRPHGLLWRDEALDDYLRWRTRWPGALPALDHAFADASVRDAVRGRRIRRGLASAAAAILIAGVIGLALLYRSSQHSAEVASSALIDSLVQQGQRELFAGDYIAALPLFTRAYQLGDRSVALRALLHRTITLAKQPRVRLGGALIDAAFSTNDHVIALGYGGDAAVIDAASGEITARLPGLPGPVHHTVAAAISSDGRLVASVRGDAIAIWDGHATRTFHVGPIDPATTRIGLDPTGAHLAIASGATLTAWDVATGAAQWSQSVGQARSLPVWMSERIAIATERGALLASADGVRTLGAAQTISPVAPGQLAVIDDTRAALFDDRGELLRSFPHLDLRTAAVSPDGHRVALGAANGVIELIDRDPSDHDRPEQRRTLAGHTAALFAAVFTPDGKRLVTSARDHTVRVWDIDQARELVRYVGCDSSLVALRLSPDGRRIVAACNDDVRIYPIDDPSALVVIDIGEPLGAASFVAGGAKIFTTSDSGVELWDARSGRQLAKIAAHVFDGAHANPDLTLAAIPIDNSHDVEIRTLPDGALRAKLASTDQPTWAVFDPAGQRVATANADGLIEIWALDGTRLATLRGHTTMVQDVAFSPDGTALLTASNDQTARLWDIAGARELRRARTSDEIDAARFDRTGGRFVTAGTDRNLTLWDSATGTAIWSFRHEVGLRSAAIGNGLIAGATASGLIQLWDTAGHKEAGRLRAAARAMAVDFAGDRLLSTSLDGRIVVWDVATELPPPDEVVAFACRVLHDSTIAIDSTLACPAP